MIMLLVSTTRFSLLGRAIANGSTSLPSSYEHRMLADILQPLGMHGSGFDLGNETVARARLATGTSSASAVPTDLGWANPNGGMYVVFVLLSGF